MPPSGLTPTCKIKDACQTFYHLLILLVQIAKIAIAMHHLHYRPIAFGYNNKTFIIKPLNLKLMFIYTLKYGRAVFYAIQRAWSVTFELFLYFFFF